MTGEFRCGGGVYVLVAGSSSKGKQGW
jgi:hypothetical protein